MTGSRMAAETILVAEDDPPTRALIREFVTRAGYRAIEADNGRAALTAVEQEAPDLVLLDVRMPALDGIELTRRLRASPATALLPIILVTGLAEVEDKVAGLDAGATDFLTKPFAAPELIARVRAALRTKSLTDRLESTQAVLVSLANAVEAKDPTTEHHCNRLVGLAIGLAREAGLDETLTEAVGYGAALHDVGKIGVSETVLRKPGGLTPEEWVEVRRHPEIGARILEPLRLGTTVAPIVRRASRAVGRLGLPARAARSGHSPRRPDRVDRGRVRRDDPRSTVSPWSAGRRGRRRAAALLWRAVRSGSGRPVRRATGANCRGERGAQRTHDPRARSARIVRRAWHPA